MYGLSAEKAAALKAAFDKVANPKDWKAKIEAEIEPSEQAIVEEAIIHYTGTLPTFVPLKRTGKMMVLATGYRAGPAGP